MKAFTGIILIGVFLLYLTSNAFSYDGSRKGKSYSIGGGVGPVSGWYKADGRLLENNIGIAIGLSSGYAFDEKNRFSIAAYQNFAISNDFDNKILIHGWAGIEYKRYLFSKTNSPFVSVGIGRHGIHVVDVGRTSGWGYLVGLGYEVKKHLNISSHFTWGNSCNRDDKNYFHLRKLDIIISYFKY